MPSTPKHMIRRWSQNDAVRDKATNKISYRMAYHWECWGREGCVKDGKPTSGVSLFKSKADEEAEAHKNS
jgi:hypothetical protein